MKPREAGGRRRRETPGCSRSRRARRRVARPRPPSPGPPCASPAARRGRPLARPGPHGPGVGAAFDMRRHTPRDAGRAGGGLGGAAQRPRVDRGGTAAVGAGRTCPSLDASGERRWWAAGRRTPPTERAWGPAADPVALTPSVVRGRDGAIEAPLSRAGPAVPCRPGRNMPPTVPPRAALPPTAEPFGPTPISANTRRRSRSGSCPSSPAPTAATPRHR